MCMRSGNSLIGSCSHILLFMVVVFVFAGGSEQNLGSEQIKGQTTGDARGSEQIHEKVLISGSEQRNRHVIMGYLPEWKVRFYPPAAAKNMTHVVYFGLAPDHSGTIKQTTIKRDLPFLEKINSISGATLLLCIGGEHTGKDFYELTRSVQTRKIFIKNVLACCRGPFRGIVIDWEYPDTTDKIRAFEVLVKELAPIMHARGCCLIVTVPAHLVYSPVIYDTVDYLHLMSYDHRGMCPTLEQARRDVEAQVNAGVRAGKICLGIPFYGRNMNQPERAMPYAAIMRTYRPGAGEDNAGPFCFNNRNTVKEKARFAGQSGLAGVMVWEISQDIHESGKSLLEVLVKAE